VKKEIPVFMLFETLYNDLGQFRIFSLMKHSLLILILPQDLLLPLSFNGRESAVNRVLDGC
jgi:hypothetical protein